MIITPLRSVLLVLLLICAGVCKPRATSSSSSEKHSSVVEEKHSSAVEEKHEVNKKPLVSLRMRIHKTEVLLGKILSEMRMPEPPAMHAPLDLPKSVLSVFENEEVEDEVLRDGDNLFSVPTNENTSCPTETDCSRYEFEVNPDSKPLSAVHMWFPTPDRPLDMSVCVSSAMDPQETCDFLRSVSETRFEIGWSLYKLPNKFAMEHNSEQLFYTVEILGPPRPATERMQQPILVASTGVEMRKRRSAGGGTTPAARQQENKNCTCCLVDFYVSFKQIGWYWVVAPLGFNANMCTGKCSNQINTYPSHYHQMLSTILNNKTSSSSSSTGDVKEDMWTPCCSPTKLSPLNMIYVAGNNTNTNSSSYSLIYHKIPNMITDSCGCW